MYNSSCGFLCRQKKKEKSRRGPSSAFTVAVFILFRFPAVPFFYGSVCDKPDDSAKQKKIVSLSLLAPKRWIVWFHPVVLFFSRVPVVRKWWDPILLGFPSHIYLTIQESEWNTEPRISWFYLDSLHDSANRSESWLIEFYLVFTGSSAFFKYLLTYDRSRKKKSIAGRFRRTHINSPNEELEEALW